MIRTATISDCERFRYRLGRRWGDGDTLLFVMLNPSTADADQDDATVRRCIRFARQEGFGALDVVNLFAFRATDPKDLRRAGYLVGPENDRHIEEAASAAAKVCLAWGSNVAGLERPQVVLPLLRAVGTPLFVLRFTRSAYPQHPLMLPASCRLVPFNEEAVDAAPSRPAHDTFEALADCWLKRQEDLRPKARNGAPTARSPRTSASWPH